MSKPNGKRYRLEQIVEKAEENLGGRVVEFDYAGETYTFPHPMLADDEWTAEFQAVGNDARANVRYLLGDEQFERFVAAGGQANHVMLLFAESQRDASGVLASGTPTRSQTS